MTKKIIKIIIILIFAQSILSVKSQAFTWSSIISDADKFVSEGKDSTTNIAPTDEESNEKTYINYEKINKANARIYNALTVLGVVLAVIVGAILGIQIMWGSIEQQVKAKEKLVPYGIGCLVIFGAFGIWKIIVSIFSNI